MRINLNIVKFIWHNFQEDAMQRVILVIDESGAKGYSDKTESSLGELGVMAGFLIPKEFKDIASNALNEIRNKYLVDRKLHITDLSPENQKNLRDEIFGHFKAHRIYWVYEAIHVEGFRNNAQMIKNLLDKAKAERKSQIKISQNESKDLLHSELFLGIFGKAVAFSIDQWGEEIFLEIISDPIDAKIISAFKQKAEELLNVGETRKQITTGFDPNLKAVVSGAIEMNISDGKDLLGDFSNVKYDISTEDSSLTLTADVLSNSVFHFLMSLQKTSAGEKLNHMATIEGHELSSLVYGAHSDDMGNYIFDIAYGHPLTKKT